MKKVACLYGTKSDFTDQMNEKAKAYAAERGLQYEWVRPDPYTKEEAIAALKDADAGIIDVDPFDKTIFSEIKDRCKILCRYGVGFDAVNLKDASECGIAITRTTAANSQAVAEMAVTMIMAAKRQIITNQAVTRSGKWVRNVGNEMLGAKVGILGFGAIGRKVAKLFSGFDADIYVYDPYLTEEQAKEAGGHKEDLETIFKECDAVSIHMPLTDETHHMVGKELIGSMKKTAVLVCTSRGGIVDEEALYEALKEKKILGAGLDVFEKEPLPADSPLLTLDNVIVTPHVAAQTEESLWNMYKKAIDVIADFFEGKEFGRGDLLNPDYSGH